jgi:hypothetical protein
MYTVSVGGCRRLAHSLAMIDRAISYAEGELLKREELERRFDGPIPAHVLEPKSERALLIDHHRAMIRFGEGRLRDFAEALCRLKNGPQGPVIDVWIARTIAILADHQAEKERHQRALDTLLREAVPSLAAE